MKFHCADNSSTPRVNVYSLYVYTDYWNRHRKLSLSGSSWVLYLGHCPTGPSSHAAFYASRTRAACIPIIAVVTRRLRFLLSLFLLSPIVNPSLCSSCERSVEGEKLDFARGNLALNKSTSSIVRNPIAAGLSPLPRKFLYRFVWLCWLTIFLFFFFPCVDFDLYIRLNIELNGISFNTTWVKHGHLQRSNFRASTT